MKYLKVGSLLLLVFAAGVAAGLLATRQLVRQTIEELIYRPDDLRGRLERQLVADLRLTPAQQSQVHAIFLRTQDRLRTVRRELQPRLAGIVQQGETELRQVFTAEQQAQFDRFKQERAPYLQFPATPP